jgi:DNA-binding helix-hairpin-helix protein with protein kinase domain
MMRREIRRRAGQKNHLVACIDQRLRLEENSPIDLRIVGQHHDAHGISPRR